MHHPTATIEYVRAVEQERHERARRWQSTKNATTGRDEASRQHPTPLRSLRRVPSSAD